MELRDDRTPYIKFRFLTVRNGRMKNEEIVQKVEAIISGNIID